MAKKSSKPAAPAAAPTPPGAPLQENTLSFEDAAELAGLEVTDVFAVNEYEDRVHVITTAGQKIVVTK
jgi:hypothetical protein